MLAKEIFEMLEHEGFEVADLDETAGLIILPIEGEYNYLRDDLIRLGAIWDARLGEWVVMKRLPVTHNDAQTQTDILEGAINYLSYPIDTQNPVVAKPCIERARNAMQVIESFLKECEAKL